MGEKKETPAPYCHGERMEPSYRYMGKYGVIYRTWICDKPGCDTVKELPLYTEEGE